MDLPSVLGGAVQGFKDFGTGLVDFFGGGTASVLDLIDAIQTGKVGTHKDDFRKWLYNTDDSQDAAAKGLGTILNGVQTVSDYIPGVNIISQNPLFNAGQGFVGGVADEFKQYGKDYDLGRATQRGLVSGGASLASGELGKTLGASSNPLLQSNTVKGAARGALGGAINQGGYTAIEGGSLADILNSAKQGATMGGLIGGTTGMIQDFRPAKTYAAGLTDDEKTARMANAKNMLANEQNPERIAELNAQIERLGGGIADRRQAQFDLLQKTNPMTDEYHTGIRSPEEIYALKNIVDSYNADNNFTYPDFTLQDAQKALANGELPVYSSKPIEPGAFISPSKMMATDYAGGGNVYTKNIPVEDFAFIESGDEGNYLPIRNNDPQVMQAIDAILTPEQKSNFVIDENGNPKVFYHGSPETNITEFDINRAGKNTRSGEKAIYFTDTPEAAEEFAYERIPTDSNFIDKAGKRGGVYEANLDMRNTLDLDNLTDAQIKELWPYASYMGSWQGEDVFARDIKLWRDAKNPQLIKGYLDLEKLASSPYDSFSATMYPNTGNKAKEYAIFDASKAKITKSPKTVADTMLSDDPGIMEAIDAIVAPNQDPLISDIINKDTSRAREIILNNDYKKSPVSNELYDKIDPSTLPKGYDKLRKFLDTQNDPENSMTALKIKEQFGTTNLDKVDTNKLLDYVYGANSAEKRDYQADLKKSIDIYKSNAKGLGMPSDNAESIVSRSKRMELIGKANEKATHDAIADIVSMEGLDDDVIHAITDYKNRSIRGGYNGALDTALSERLGIAPGNTIKIDSDDYLAYSNSPNSTGRYMRGAKDIDINRKRVAARGGTETAVSAMAHERLHSFQNEAQPENLGRYSKEVTDAYKELSKDLKPFLKNEKEIKQRYKDGRTEYWLKQGEQESRMLQNYLENKKITSDALYGSDTKGEWGNEINPAFDKFFDKLRKLSKKGVALPAITALLGGGAYLANTTDDKDKEIR